MLKNPFPIIGNSFQRKPKLIAKLIFYILYLKQYFRTKCRKQVWSLLEISEKFIIKFNVFSCMVLQVRLKTVWKISKSYCMILKIVAR